MSDLSTRVRLRREQLRQTVWQFLPLTHILKPVSYTHLLRAIFWPIPILLHRPPVQTVLPCSISACPFITLFLPLAP